MTVRREEVEHVARLAAVAIDDESLTELTGQISRILEYVSQLETVEDNSGLEQEGYPGPHQPLREDRAQRSKLALPLEDLAPAFRDGLFLVPRLGAVGDATPDGDE